MGSEAFAFDEARHRHEIHGRVRKNREISDNVAEQEHLDVAAQSIGQRI